jgi:hypothetical protein
MSCQQCKGILETIKAERKRRCGGNKRNEGKRSRKSEAEKNGKCPYTTVEKE